MISSFGKQGARRVYGLGNIGTSTVEKAALNITQQKIESN